jgi:release factor glutamine methyltransferase
LRGHVDVAVSNPPYVATDDELPNDVAEWEPSSALFAGGDGLDDLRRIVADAPAWLGRPGALVVECAPTQADVVADMSRAAGFADTVIHPDLAGRPRAVVCRT